MPIIDAARSTPGRAAAAIVGLAIVALIVRGLGIDDVTRAVAQAAPYLPIVIVLEVAILACSTLALRALYRDAARVVPTSQLARAALIGYAVQGVVPAGRAAAEATRASLLAGWVGRGRAGAAATRMQAVVLIANGLISVPAAIAAARTGAMRWLPLAIAINAGVTLSLGFALLLIIRHAHIGHWIGRRLKRVRAFGAELDAAFEDDVETPVRAIAWELAGRCVQVAQHAVLIVCVGGAFGIVPALCAEGIHLVGAAVGDLIPAQLGATEGNFTLSARALGLAGTSAVSIALLAHLVQLLWVLIGAFVPLLWRAADPVHRSNFEETR